MRRVLLVLLGFGVFAGYGSAIASARWHHRQGGCEGRWSRGSDGYDNRFEGRFGNRDEQRTVAAPPQAQVINVPQAAAPAPAPSVPAQQIFLIMPGAQGPAAAAPQVITVPVPTAAPAAPPAPAAATP